LLMYATPIIYAYSAAPKSLKPYLNLNPLVAPVECFKYALFGIGEFSLYSILYSFVWMVLSILIGIILFNKAEKNFMDIV
jgi:lipopolysaccharide transport system permease protein